VLSLGEAVFAAAPPNFAQLTIPRVSSPPQLEDFLDMTPGAAWEGKLVKVDRFIQRRPQ
jgi:hypothetical protein